MSAANLSRQERKSTPWKHLLRCVRPTRHISACLSGIKTNPGHLISPASTAKKTLEGWYRGEKRAMKFAIPRIWREPTDHSSNCYFCMVDPSKRRTGKNAPAITYPDLPSSIAPVPHCHELPVPTPLEREQPSLEESSKSESEEDVVDPDDNFRGGAEERNPYYPNQKDLNDLIRDLGLTKSNAELLTSRLKQWNLLDESVQVADQRKRHQPFSRFFTRQDGLYFCHNVTSLFEAIGIACNQNEWRLFIDSSSRSLKAVLLHNGNKYPSLPLAHSVHLKEDYNSIKTLLDALKYDEYGWEVIGDFKMVAFLMGFPAIFAFGTAGTPRRTTTGGTGHSGPSSLWGGTTSSGSHWWTPGRC
ncbi:uncharacterized protein LOC131740095 [Acipenser ruthenus]|uniref:uncharacterized protein LOC131740095 n=1 Tax=Acipenser ruthenus TaxID=7906 RepID=UPI002741563F|nr:uncharacterized protein LOC131740095 [Acipenser ruthenus]